MKNSQADQTLRKIANVALRLFVKNGYHGTSIADISNGAKVTKGAIYFHFRNKDALLRRIFEEYERIFLDKMIEEVGSGRGTGFDKIKHLFKFSADFAARNRTLCICLTKLSAELSSSRKKYEEDAMRYYGKYQGFLSNLLKEGVEDASLRENIDPDILALNLIGAHEGNLLQWNMNRGKISAEKFARSYMKFFLSGIAKYR